MGLKLRILGGREVKESAASYYTLRAMRGACHSVCATNLKSPAQCRILVQKNANFAKTRAEDP